MKKSIVTGTCSAYGTLQAVGQQKKKRRQRKKIQTNWY